MSKPRAYCSDDYAGLEFDGGSFYYGYEHSICTTCGKKTGSGTEYCEIDEHEDREWCFVADIEGTPEIVIPMSKLGIGSDMFDVNHCLMIGIGWVLTKYKPEIKKALDE